ncbi:MAG: hypothetical protein HUU01_17420 [Saprospiraceae bacterium]|nr:hypothetical protein [Saprospiraceae bacterium]
MARRLRLTGFTRFLIVMLFLVPIAYIGASYYNGQDGLANFKNLIGLGKSDSPSASRETAANPKGIAKLEERITQLNERITELELKNGDLESQLENKDQEIVELKSRLMKCK